LLPTELHSRLVEPASDIVLATVTLVSQEIAVR